jgi:thiamine-monophosphate kinase
LKVENVNADFCNRIPFSIFNFQLNMSERTEISSLGEFGLIKHLAGKITTHQPTTVKGIGDDAAVLAKRDKLTVVTTDMLVEGVHFDLMYVPLKHLGYKSIAVNLSDICAMNGVPTQVTVAIALSNRFSVEAVDELYEGMRAACKRYNVDLVGGDTTTSLKGLIISVTAIGEVEDGKQVYRSTANEGDLLCVTGDIGGAYLGLQLLEREKRIFLENPDIKPDLEEQKYLVGRQLKPEPRTDIIKWLGEMDILPTSMIDISDGLSSEALHLCEQSGLGCEVMEDKIPISEEARQLAFKFTLDPTMCALSGGEDYELLFTIKREDEMKLKGSLDVTVIGEMTAAGTEPTLITRQGNRHKLVAQGWSAFGN